MTRTEAFTEVARASDALSKLAGTQKDTVDWWTQFGTEWQKLTDAMNAAAPKKDTHRNAALTAMEKVRVKE